MGFLFWLPEHNPPEMSWEHLGSKRCGWRHPPWSQMGMWKKFHISLCSLSQLNFDLQSSFFQACRKFNLTLYWGYPLYSGVNILYQAKKWGNLLWSSIIYQRPQLSQLYRPFGDTNSTASSPCSGYKAPWMLVSLTNMESLFFLRCFHLIQVEWGRGSKDIPTTRETLGLFLIASPEKCILLVLSKRKCPSLPAHSVMSWDRTGKEEKTTKMPGGWGHGYS